MQEDKQFVKEIADINSDFPQWYTDIVLKTELVDYGPARGTMVIRPYGYAIWENIQAELNKRFKATGHVNAYFPMLIPESLLKKEAEHVEGFAPEVATVTRAGNEQLTEPLIVRPTSETIICSMYSQWVHSYRDLPILINQWANVVRWEKTTRPFLRTREFLWQEGHTVHSTSEEALKETMDMLELYKNFCEDFLAMPVLTGRKSEKEKFAGAEATFGMESMTLDGKSLQSGTTHFFGDKFSRAYDIKFLDKDGELKYAWQTSWGVSTRLIGGLIMAHGDQRGLVLPPRVAPIQVIVVPIAFHKEGVLEATNAIIKGLNDAGVRAQGDFSENTAGWKFNQWEMKGVPLRLEVGPRDVAAGVVTAVRRDTHEKFTMPISSLNVDIPTKLDEIQKSMYDKSLAFRNSHIKDVSDMAELKDALDGGNLTRAVWCTCPECEAAIKEQTQATIRVFVEDALNEKCIYCGKTHKDSKRVIVARAY